MAYLTYAEYQQTGGARSEAEFAALEMRAAKLIDALTHGRVREETPVREAVRQAALALVAAMDADGDNAGREVISMDNDGVSVAYAAGDTQAGRWARIAREYLRGEVTAAGVALTYAGVGA